MKASCSKRSSDSHAPRNHSAPSAAAAQTFTIDDRKRRQPHLFRDHELGVIDAGVGSRAAGVGWDVEEAYRDAARGRVRRGAKRAA